MASFGERLASGEAYIIAEMSANHGGSLEHALRIVEAAANAGADCLKVQTFTADTITIDSHAEYFEVHGGLWDGMYLHDLYEEASLPWEWHKPIRDTCVELGLDFLSTPFDPTAVDFLEDLGVDAYKIASPELVDVPLIEYTASKGKPMIISTGMGTESEIRDAVEAARRGGAPEVVLLQCCSQYPANPANMNLSLMTDMRERFGCMVGLSDHSPGSLGPVVARTLGACVIEKHFCITHEDKGPDASFSMTAEEFAQMACDVRTAEKMLGEAVYGPSEGEVRALRSRRSLFVVADVKAGDAVTELNVRSIRPGQGLAPKLLPQVLGMRFTTDATQGTPLSLDMLEDAEGGAA